MVSLNKAGQAERTAVFQRNQSLENLLQELNFLLNGPEEQIESQFETPDLPVVFIIGAPRSGTTLALQWLASTKVFGYPSNLISRFYAAPYIGAKVQRMLIDPEFNFKDEFKDFAESLSFASNLGKTRGLLAPNEFWYFWRRFIPNEEPRHLRPEEVEEIDRDGFAASLAALESALEKPLAMKGLILQYNLDVLASMLRHKVLFIHTWRNPFYNIQSLLNARERYYGTKEKWYSVKPKEYAWLKDLPPVEQVTGQVYFTNQSITEQLEHLPEACTLRLPYESFCRNPSHFFEQLMDRLEEHNLGMEKKYQGPEAFESTNRVKVSEQDRSKIIGAWEQFSGKTLTV